MMVTRLERPPLPGMSREEASALTGLIALFAITGAWWALAFWPVQDGPAWLERTRYVCFGVAEDGLPDAGGWIGLIAGPLGMLTILVVGWGRGVRAILQRSRQSLPLAVIIGLLLVGCMALIGGATLRVQQSRSATRIAGPAEPGVAASIPRIDRPAPNIQLTAHDGTLLSLEHLRGRPVLVTFAYAHCETICPLVVKDVLRAQEMMRGSAAFPAVLIVTLDPWRDTPSRLATIARQWALPNGEAWVLGGSVAAVDSTLDAYEVQYTRDLQNGEITHPSLVYVIDARGSIAFVSAGGAATLASLLSRL
jgi:cytochrome oxidase Cu insertion factor (SCO1/SenC/PrrC family)